MKTGILIIGAGPTGLMAANQLARFGIDFIILDKKDGPTEQSRAIAVTSRSLEIYEQMGLSETVIEGGTRINSFAVYSEGKKKGGIELGEIGSSISDFNFMLAFEQSKNEKLLYANLKKSERDVLWEHELLEVKQNDDEVTIIVQSKNGQKNFNARYLIAADGAKSVVRHQLGFKFEGGTYENKFFVADAEIKWDLPYDRLTLFPSQHNFCAFFPLKGSRNGRLLGTLPKKYSENDEVQFSDLEEVIKSAMKVDITFTKVNWFSVYKLHHRGVDRFINGNIFLAGDSAHIHSPAGGQGMNTGLQDAYNLAWKMAYVIKGYARRELLETYNEERLPFARWLLGFTDRMFNVMTNDSWFFYVLRKYITLNLVGFMLSIKAVRSRAFLTLSQVWYSYKKMSLSADYSRQKLKFRAGDRFPYLKNETNAKSFYTLFNPGGYNLVCLGDTDEKALSCIKEFPFPIHVVKSGLSQKWKDLGVSQTLFILVRPDNYIAFISDTLNGEIISAYSKKAFLNF